MKRHIALASVAMVLQSQTAGMRGGQVILHESREGILRHVELMSREAFSVRVAKAAARQFLDENAGYPFVQFQIVTSKAVARPAPKSPVPSFDGWRRLYRKYQDVDWCVAEAVATSGSAVLKTRDQDGKIQRLVMRGTDPLLVTEGRNRYELLYFDFPVSPSGNVANVRVFIKSFQPLDPTRGDLLLKQIATRLPFRRADLYIRTDDWFIFEQGFPYFYPFSTSSALPTESEYLSSPTMSCSFGWNETGCTMGAAQ